MDVTLESRAAKALTDLQDWKRRDPTVREMVAVVVRHHGAVLADIARAQPELIIELHEEAAALMENPE